ncbi:MAG: type IX secretion system sortase PorU, partial [Candidatus Azobacteroides sp.]|nr:type IX secretion system sortase PorU [Candidatus Azobacteroides sp.]
PDATKKLHNLLKSGVLMVNYTGHGSTTSWAEEQIYTSTDAQTLPVTKLPLFVTATCDFTRFDDIKTSAGEYVLLNPNGGGIALFSTTRVVFSDGNFSINKEFCNYIFSKREDGTRLRLGDIMRLSKRNLRGNNNKLSFTLIGDPALTLAYPEYHAEILTINGKDASEEQTTFSAGSTISLTGRILNPDGSASDSFNGRAYLNLYDAEEVLFQITTSPNKTIYDRTSLLFTGKDTISNGEFSFNFVVPKDISYSYQPGRINIYAVDSENNNEAQGYFENFIVGDTDENGINDEKPPVINYLYLNNPDFKNGDTVNDTPVFFAEVEDDTGINISGNGIGHDVTITIDHSPYEVYTLNEYFESEIGNPKKGVFQFSIPTLSTGKHNLTFRVWDIMNNSSTATIEFNVHEGLAPKIFDLYTAPNPAREATNFYLTHDRPESQMTVRIDVYSLNGQLVWSHTESGYSETFNAVPISWDLRTSGGQRLSPGIYVYRATISSNGSSETSGAKKIIILGQ